MRPDAGGGLQGCCRVGFSSLAQALCFTITATARSPAHLGKAWGVVATDIKNDGRMDLFVANDTVANFLFANRRGLFEEII